MIELNLLFCPFANGGRLLLQILGPVPYETCKCYYFGTIPKLFKFPVFEFWTSLCTSTYICLSVFCQLQHLLLLKRQRLHIWHAYSTNEAWSNDANIDWLVTLTLSFLLTQPFTSYCQIILLIVYNATSKGLNLVVSETCSECSGQIPVYHIYLHWWYYQSYLILVTMKHLSSQYQHR